MGICVTDSGIVVTLDNRKSKLCGFLLKQWHHMAMGTPRLSKDPDEPIERKDRIRHGIMMIFFLIGVGAVLSFGIFLANGYRKDDLLSTKTRSYHYVHKRPMPFPNVYVCNNFPTPGLHDYPKHVNCSRFSFSFTETPQPCKQPFVKTDVQVANRTCLLYSNQEAYSRTDTWRLTVAVGGQSTIETPWKGAFMILRDPDDGHSIDENIVASSRWSVLSPRRYLLIHLEKEVIYKLVEGPSSHYYSDDRTNRTRYIVATPESAPLDYPGMGNSTVVIDLLYRSFEETHRHELYLRTIPQLLAGLGGAASWLGICMRAGALVFGIFSLLAYCCTKNRGERQQLLDREEQESCIQLSIQEGNLEKRE